VQNSDNSDGSDSEAEEEIGELPVVAANNAAKPKPRQSVSAECFGRFNAKEAFIPTIIAKSAEIK